MKTKSLYQSYLFWIIFVVVSAVSGYLTLKMFPKAFPFINVDITMSRSEALAKAAELAQHYNLGPEHPQQAATFSSDDHLKTFIELEAGGVNAFVKMMEQGLYEPYQWKVRHMQEFNVNEAFFYFTPQGVPYGFTEIISENAPGEALNSDQALSIAQTKATNDWNVDFSQYALVDSSKEVKPSGRIDHTFVFERAEKIGEGFYRLQLVVSGNKLTTVERLVKVPEAFFRRYQELRSANETIANLSFIIMMILYIVGGCFIGLFFLFRENLAIWHSAVYWAFGIAFLEFIDSINRLPLSWFRYQTEHSSIAFIVNFILNSIISFFFSIPSGLLFMVIIFLTAEGLTRRGLPDQPQLWKSWTPQVGSSFAILGRTIGAYILVPFDLLYVTTFYIITTRYFGWWVPASELFDPNILATYFPWLHSVVASLCAGFMEECLFRAIPLGGILVISRKWKPNNRRIALLFVLILQAVIFAGAHANYTTQPAYARVVELIPMSLLFALIYLQFGLIPGIISHYCYDIFWFSLPLFVSTAPGIWTNRILVMAGAAIPLFAIIFARIKYGRWIPLPEQWYNYAWKAETLPDDTKKERMYAQPVILPPSIRKNCLIAGVLGLCIWLMNVSLHDDAQSIQATRNQAIEVASQALAREGVDSEWYPMTNFFGHFSEHFDTQTQHRFIWREGGKDLYKTLLNSYLKPPFWDVRFAKFVGDVVERARQYHVHVTDDGVIKTEIILPEHDSGKLLTEAQARDIAHKALVDRYQIALTNIKEISAVADKQPNRMDWVFTFADTKTYPLDKGQARLRVKIAGDKVLEIDRFVFVPEEWIRAERSKTLITANVKKIIGLLIYLLFIIGMIAAGYRLSQRHTPMHIKTLIITTIALSVMHLLNLVLTWPEVVATFNTSEPFFHQVVRFYSVFVVWNILKSSFLAILIVFINSVLTRYFIQPSRAIITGGISIGLAVAGSLKLIQTLVPSLEPNWAEYNVLDNYLPLVYGTIFHFSQFLYLTLFFLLWTLALNLFTHQLQRRQIVGTAMIFGISLLLVGSQHAENLTLWFTESIALGAILAVAYTTIIRFDIRTIPVATATFYTFIILQQGLYNPFVGARFIMCASIGIIWLVALLWIRHLVHPEYMNNK